MILCPSCQHNELVGALYCSECGALLAVVQGDPPATSAPRPNEGIGLSTPPFPSTSINTFLFLHLIECGAILPVSPAEEITLGRIGQGQPIIPDVDLGPYQAYEGGVSRLHACLKTVEKEVMLVDLESANGTRLNGQKIPAHLPQLLAHGDIITLGKLKIQILIRS